MQQSQTRRSITVGIFIFIGLVMLASGILVVGNKRKTFSKSIALYADFKDVNGLQKGNNIWFSGVKIGTVKQMTLFNGGTVKVEMKISAKAQSFILKDARARIATDGLIGNKIVEIYGGTAGGPTVNANDVLLSDMRPNPYEMMNTLQENNKNLAAITGNIKTVSARLVNGEGTLGSLLTSDTLARELQRTASKLNIAADNIQTMTKDIQVVTKDIQVVAKNMQFATGNFAGYSAKLNNKGTLAHELVNDTAIFSTLKASAAQIKQASVNANELTNNLKKFSTTLKDSAGIAGVLLHDTAAASNLKSTFENLQAGTQKFDENMEALQHNFLFKRFFKKKAQLRRQQQQQELLTCPKPQQFSAKTN
jgi:phospholipid/cholesterol/gamma-HCH transport system substrate-binding protein